MRASAPSGLLVQSRCFFFFWGGGGGGGGVEPVLSIEDKPSI